MKNISQDIEDLVKGNITKEKFSLLEHWTRQCEANRCYVRDLREMIFSQEVLDDRKRYDVSSAINRFYLHVSKLGSVSIPQTATLISRTRLWKRVLSVAVIVLLLLVSVFTYYFGYNKVEQQFSEITVKVPNGSQLDLILPDGTKVRLNSGSQLRYSQGYGIVDRRLVFSGEGYFKVHHNQKFPFIIETKGLALKDIGTEFNIRNYADDDCINVNLFHGSVEIHNKIRPSIPVLMSPGECLILDKQNGKIQKGKCGVDMNSAFMMNDLDFIDMNMSDIAKQLTRSYGVDIEVANKVQHRRFYGFFNRKDDSLNEILKVISSTGLVKYKQLQGKYLIY